MFIIFILISHLGDFLFVFYTKGNNITTCVKTLATTTWRNYYFDNLTNHWIYPIHEVSRGQDVQLRLDWSFLVILHNEMDTNTNLSLNLTHFYISSKLWSSLPSVFMIKKQHLRFFLFFVFFAFYSIVWRENKNRNQCKFITASHWYCYSGCGN